MQKYDEDKFSYLTTSTFALRCTFNDTGQIQQLYICSLKKQNKNIYGSVQWA
jgi:hypothetical protein